MLKIINVSVNNIRLRESIRSRLFAGGEKMRVNWGAESNLEGDFQTACRLTVNTGRVNWDSGWTKTRLQEALYEGPAFQEGERVDFTIEIMNRDGRECAAYSNTIYNASVLWRAGWIGAREDIRKRCVYLRREFEIDRPIISATLYACGVGYHKISVNGVDIDTSALDPAFTDYSKTCMYVMYPELEKLLRTGANCIGAILGDGWRRNVLVSRKPADESEREISFCGAPEFTSMLKLDYADGETRWLLSDGEWQCGWGANRESDIFNGSVYDANYTVAGWDMPGYIGFTSARQLPAPGGVMRPMLIPPITEHLVLKPVSHWCIGDNRVIFDFGRNIAGVTRVRMPDNMRKGHVITIKHSEELDEDGSLYTDTLRSAKATDTYIASSDCNDLSVWQPIFTYHGFRYVMAEGLADADGIEAVELHTDMDSRSMFSCGDALATRIHRLCIDTERANQHGIFTDCPQRDERLGWMNDATVRFEETPYNFDTGAMFPKIIRDISDGQLPNGCISSTAPFVAGNTVTDPVSSGFPVALRMCVSHSGDISVIKEFYDSLSAWTNFVLSRSDGYICNYTCNGDWAAPSYACICDVNGETPFSNCTPGIFMSTGYSYYNCRTLESFAEILGRSDEKEKWANIAENVKTAMLDKWYDSGTAKMATGSQACQAFSLWLGIIPKGDEKRAAKIVSDELRANGYMLTTGNLCSRYILDALTENGYLDDAWKLITRTEYPSIGYMIQQEATTVWERFELTKDPSMNSHNHPMYAALDYWFFAYLCGVKPTKPGYDEILIKPCFPSGLKSAHCVVDTVKGDVSVRWVKRYGRLLLYVSVPFGSRARVDFDGEITDVSSGFHTFSSPCDDC